MSLPKKYRLDSYTLKSLKKITPTKKFSGNCFYLNFYQKVEGPAFSFIILKKHMPKAVYRNKIKRFFRIAIMSNIESFAKGYYVFVSRKDLSGTVTSESINIELNSFISKISKFR